MLHNLKFKILIVCDNKNNLLSLRALIEKNFKQA